MEANKNLLFFTTLLLLVPVLGFIILLFVWFTQKDKLEGEAKDYLKNLTNFQLLLFILSIILGFAFAPLVSLIGLFNLVIIILAAINIFNGKNFKFPFLLEIVK